LQDIWKNWVSVQKALNISWSCRELIKMRLS